MRTRLVALLCAAVVLTGCEGEPAPDAAAPSYTPVTLPPPPPGIAMSFVLQRIWEGTRRADVRILNNTTRALEVRRVGISWPGFPAGTQRRVARVGPGATLDLRYRLPAPDCRADPATPAVGVAVTAGRTVRRRVDEAGMRFLTRLWAAACAARKVRRLLDVSLLVPAPGRDEQSLSATLRLLRRPGAPSPEVELTSVQGTVLFDLAASVVGPGRCDEHARSQASQPYTFRFGLLIGDATVPASVVVLPNRSGRVRLLELLDRACAGITQH
jgi:hypothetical protein